MTSPLTAKRFVPLPSFSVVWCDWTQDNEIAAEGHCSACGSTSHTGVVTR